MISPGKMAVQGLGGSTLEVALQGLLAALPEGLTIGEALAWIRRERPERGEAVCIEVKGCRASFSLGEVQSDFGPSIAELDAIDEAAEAALIEAEWAEEDDERAFQKYRRKLDETILHMAEHRARRDYRRRVALIQKSLADDPRALVETLMDLQAQITDLRKKIGGSEAKK